MEPELARPSKFAHALTAAMFPILRTHFLGRRGPLKRTPEVL